MIERKGDWFQTFTGNKFYPLDPKVDEIFIEDIAHALSVLCRFGGHCLQFYSVAQHCVIGADELYETYGLDKELAFNFLMHDASEAYLNDLIRPLKRASDLGKLYRVIEERLEFVLASKFKLTYPYSVVVKNMDSRMLLTEKRDLVRNFSEAWKEEDEGFVPLDVKITPWTPAQSETTFLERFNWYSK